MDGYRKKPIVIEAVQLTRENTQEVIDWITSGDKGYEAHRADFDCAIDIQTLEGVMRADLDDFIIQGVQGEFYPCKPDIFNATYDKEG